jgi:hypothetical protein
MTTSDTPDMAPRSAPTEAAARSPAFDALSTIVRDAQRGEMRLPPPLPKRATGPSAPRLDEAARLPLSWYRKTSDAKPDFTRDMLRAAAFGLATGLMLLVPLVWMGSARPARFAASLSEPLPALTLAAQSVEVRASTTMSPSDRMRAIIELARLRVIVGDVAAARTVLSRADVARDADALFLMAETYDPHMLDVWGARGVTPDSDRARALYAAANALGHMQADERLAALK